MTEQNKPGGTASAPTAPPASGPPFSAKPAPPQPPVAKAKPLPTEIGGPKGPEPTRYGDWQYKGRVTDF